MKGAGEHEVWFGEAGEGNRARRLGYEVRDTLLLVVEGGVRVGWLVRRPLVGTVVENVLVTGTGGLCVDACRVAFAGASDFAETAAKNQHGDFGSGARENRIYGEIRSDRVNYVSSGRWPSNTLLVHGAGCSQKGTREVRASAPAGPGIGGRPRGVYGEDDPASFRGNGSRVCYGADGAETVASWACGEGCLVPVLDEQSGECPTGKPTTGSQPTTNGVFGKYAERSTVGGGDTGGASRFFPQLGPDALLDWLDALTS